MSDKFLSLGTVVVFSIVLPGVVLLGLAAYFDPALITKDISAFYLSSVALVVGFTANGVGHAAGILFRKIVRKYSGVPFTQIYLKSYSLSEKDAALMRKDSEYWFSIYCLYWNTACGVPLVGFYYREQLGQNYGLAVLLVIAVVILCYLSIHVLDGIIEISSMRLQPKTSPDFATPESLPGKIKFLQEEDINAVVDILSHPKNSPNIWYSLPRAEFVGIIRKWTEDSSLACLTVRDDQGIPVGFAKVRKWVHDKRKHVAWIGPVAVHPDCWRKGYGADLLNAIDAVCRSSKIHRLEVMVPEDAKGIRGLLKKLGFQEEGTQRHAIRRGDGNYTDIIQYAKILV
jgi:RimJ/RimL family protein N-acetyltransferase